MVRTVSSINGAVHDVARLKAMDLEPCYIIGVSETTLNIIQNYAIDEIGFLSRYGVGFDGGYYTPIDEDHADFDFVLDTIRRYRLEVNDLTCDLVEAINGLTAVAQTMVECCQTSSETSSQDGDSTPHDGVVSVGQPGDQFPDEDAFSDAKCNAANASFDTIRDFMIVLGEQIDTIKLGFGITSGLIALAAIAGPASWAIFGISAVVISMAYHLLTYTVDYTDMEDALDDVHSELVLALYNSTNTQTAKDDFLTELANSTPALSVPETALISMMLTSQLLNQLFEPRSDVAVYASPDPIACTDPDPIITVTGTDTPDANIDGTQFDLVSVEEGGIDIVKVSITAPMGFPCVNYNIEIVSMDDPGGSGGLISDCLSVDVWRWNNQGYGGLIGDWTARHVHLHGTAPFTVEIIITELP